MRYYQKRTCLYIPQPKAEAVPDNLAFETISLVFNNKHCNLIGRRKTNESFWRMSPVVISGLL